MATKAIYTKVDGQFYRLDQSILNPDVMFKMPGTHAQLSFDTSCKAVNAEVWVNPISDSPIKTNEEAYQEMINYITNNELTEIDTVQNRFLMYLDYSVYNENNTELNHNVATKELEPIDAIYPYGVDKEEQLMYKQVKSFGGDIEFAIKNRYPYGIMYDNSKVRYRLVINDISLYQDLINRNSFCDVHYSADGNTYAYGSHTISETLNGLKKIYSSYDNGLVINAVDIPFVPRSITIHFNIAVDNIIVVYDNQTVRDAIIANIVKKHPNAGTAEIPDGEKYPQSDGSTAENNGYYDYWKKVSKDEVGALQVVSDDVTGDKYNTSTMIHISMVLKDIPDAVEGDYVKYFSVAVVNGEYLDINGGTATR